MESKRLIDQEIDTRLAEIELMRERKRNITAAVELRQVLNAFQQDRNVTDAQIERLVQVLMDSIRQPLEEKIAFQSQEIASLRQSVNDLTALCTAAKGSGGL